MFADIKTTICYGKLAEIGKKAYCGKRFSHLSV